MTCRISPVRVLAERIDWMCNPYVNVHRSTKNAQVPQNATAIYQSGSSYNYNYNYSTVQYNTLRYATLYTHHYTSNKYDDSNSNDM